MLSKMKWKCFLVICIFFMMCPKRVRVGKIKKKLQGPLENNISKLSLELPENEETKPKPEDNANGNEPGFDLTEDEMAKFKIWPQGIIPYYIDDLSFDKVFRDRLRSFLETAGGTGLHFFELPKAPEDKTRWVFFINRRGVLECPDYTTDDFTNDGVQRVILGYDCLDRQRTLAGTVLALAGVPPQHNAPDRDKYVQINTENIMPDKQNLFKALGNDEWLFHDVDYDYSSAGHFDWHKYSANGKATISPKKKINENDAEMGSFTSTDLQKIRMLYNYVSKHAKLDSSKIAECNQLFVPGTKFSNYESGSEETAKPRKKPNKYLGISDDVQDNNENIISQKENSNEKDIKEVEKKEGNDLNKNDDKERIEVQNVEDDNEQGSENEMKTDNNNEKDVEEVEKKEENDFNKNNDKEGIEVKNDEYDNEQDSKNEMKTDNKEDGPSGQNNATKNNKNSLEENNENIDNKVTVGSQGAKQNSDTKKLKSGLKQRVKTVTQAEIFDLSDFDTNEKWEKLKGSKI